MTKYSLSIMSGLAIASLSFAIAEEAAEKCEKACKVAVASDCAECPLTAAMEALPKISYVIAGEASACAKSAEAAAEAGKEVKYVVAGKELCCPTSAQEAHLGAVETFVASFASTHAYDASGKTFVGNKGFECGEHAKTIAAVAKTAMAEVKTVHFVGTQEFCCPTAAGEAAEKEGAKVTYVVNEEKTQCAKSNRMNVAVAKYKAAVLAIAKAEAPEKSAS
ncbi:MAG: hypothetical protein ACI957_004450 [Verrucomicrobiales bacterium]|jgi:hypothetical protein